MSKLNRFVALAFLRLKAPEFAPLRDYLAQVHQKALEDMSTVIDPEHWRKLQGRAQLAKELLDNVESSSDTVAKFDSRPQ
jgi:hypothetical protein